MSDKNFFKEIADEIKVIAKDILEIGGERWHRHKPQKEMLILSSITINNITIKGNIMGVTLKKTQFVDALLSPVAVDASGNQTPGALAPNATVNYSSSDETVFTVVPDTSNILGVRIIAVADGVAQLLATSTNPSGGTVSGSDTITVADEVVPPPPPPTPDATSFAFAYGTPQDQTPAPATAPAS